MYLMTCTQPDLAYPLSLLARYVALGRHRKVHWDAAKRVLRYVCSMSGMGLVLGGRARVVLTSHADASWVDDLATQRSSSCEAEIYAGSMAAQELRWLTYLLTDLGEQPRLPPVLYQRGQIRLAYVASQANTADVFTKALQPCDHQPCFAFLDWSYDLLFSPTLPMGDLRAYLLHAEYKAQRGDPAGGLELISHALNLISGRFEVLQVEDTSDFRTAKRFKLYQQKSLLTSRPFKQAVADMAAMDRAASPLLPSDPESDSLRAASPTFTRFLATAVTNPLFESTTTSALVTELVDFAAACRLDYTTSLVAESASVCPPSVGGECALGTDVLEDRQEDLDDIFNFNRSTMAPTPTLNNGNSSNPASDSDRNTRDLAGERRNKRRAEDGPPALTAVDVLMGGLEVNKRGNAQQHPSAPVAPVAPAAQVATAAGAAHATDAEHTPAPAAGPSRQRQRRRTMVSSSDATTAPTLTHALTPNQVNALLSLLQQQPVSELLEDLRTYLLHAEYKAQRGDPAGGLELISHALNLISGRFEVLQVEDASDFRTAKRFKLYQQKSLLTS
ncbi:unnamed protein product [Closterium sp. NIES-53]